MTGSSSNCCKYKANGTRKESQKNPKPVAKKNKNNFEPILADHATDISHPPAGKSVWKAEA